MQSNNKNNMSIKSEHEAAFSFNYERSIDPNENKDVYIAQQIKQNYLNERHQPNVNLLASIDSGYAQGDLLFDAWLEEAKSLPKQGMPLFKQALEQGIDTVSDAPNTLKALFEQAQTIPDWLDNERLLCGSHALERYPIIQGLILQSVSLMGGYSLPALAQPLIETGALSLSPVSRMARTLGFIAAVTIPRGLALNKVGHKQALRVRMVHGVVRANLANSNKWDFKRFGVPINQSDLIATNMMFSLVVIHGLLKFNCSISDDEQEGILHLWRYVAYLLGIDDALMPKTQAESNQWLYAYLVTQKMDAKSARPLAQSLHQLPPLIETFPWKKKAIFEQGLRASVTRLFWGDEVCDDLGLPNSSIANQAMKSMMLSQGVSEFLQRYLSPITWLMDASAKRYRDYVKAQYLTVKPDLKPLFDEIEATYEGLI